MSRNSRRSRRRSSAIQRLNGKSWLRRYFRALRTGVTVASIGTLGLLGQPAHAANNLWIGNTSVNWNDPTNWSTNPAGPLTGDTLEFNLAGTSGLTLTDNLMTPATYNVAGITFDATAASFIVNPATVGTNGFTLTGNITNSSTALQTINDAIVTTAPRTVTTTAGGGNITLGGAISGAAGGITKNGAGTLTLGGANTYTGQTLVNAGTVNLTGSIIATGQPNPFVQIGGAAATAQGAMTVGAGATLSGSTELWIGTGDGGYGVLNNNGGTISSGSWFALARGGGQGVYNQSSGSLTVSTNPLTIGSFGGSTAAGVVHGVVNISGGTLTTVNQPIYVGEQTLSVMTVSGTAQVTAGTGIVFAQNNATAAGSTLNLLGGTTSTTRVAQNLAAGTVNFNGGTLKATGSNPTFMQGLTGNAYIYGGGGTIDDGGFAITVNQALVAPTGSGVSAAGLTFSGGGYIGTPVVQINGDGSGATAVANIDASGNLTGITITNPGRDYFTPPTFTLLGGGIGNTGAIGGSATLVDNTLSHGGLTKAGSGTLTLGAFNTYTGSTTISAGTLLLSSAGSINSSSSISINGTGARLLQNSSQGIAPAIAVTNGTLDGVGSVGSVTVANLATNLVVNGTSGAVVTANPLSFSDLTFSGAATVQPTTSTATKDSPALAVGGALTVSGGAGSITVNPVNSGGGWVTNTYKLVGYGSLTGPTSAFSLNTASMVLGFRQTAQLSTASGTSIDLVIGGDSALWTGALDGNWTKSAQSAPHNWVLQSTPATQTDYMEPVSGFGDAVVFDDSAVAAGPVTVNISASDVKPALATFQNNSKAYVLTGSPNGSGGTFGITGAGGVIVTGTGSLTINNANTYSGGTSLTIPGAVFNIGTPNALNTATASAIGQGRLTLPLNAIIDNTSGAAATLLTNNPQTWNGDLTFAGSNDLNLGSGAVSVNPNGSNVTAGFTTVTVNSPAGTRKTFGVGAINAPTGLVKTGPGTLAVQGGTLSDQIRMVDGAMKVTAGTLNISGTNPSIAGGFNPGNNVSFFVTGGIVNTTGETWLAPTSNSYGSLTVTGGTYNSGSFLVAARSRFLAGDNGGTGVGVINLTGGAINVATNDISLGSFGNGSAFNNSSSLMNITGGTLTTAAAASGILVGGGSGPGWFNISGNGTTQGALVLSNTGGEGVQVGAGFPGILNLGAIGSTGISNNGRITTPLVNGGQAQSGTFNFHGGTLRANVANANFMRTLTGAFIYSEGAVIDSNGVAITIPQILSAPTGSGVAATADSNHFVSGLTVTGSGFIDTPFVQVTGGGGIGATAVAVVDYTTGNLTGIKLTNPGTGYTSAPTFTLLGGGIGATSSVTGTATLAANVGGGLTKIGAGTLSLSGVNTYTGGTTVNAGLVGINSASALGTGALTIGASTGGPGIDNTSGVAVTSANPENWNFDLIYGGTRNLTLTGPISFGANAGTVRTITTNAATAATMLTVASPLSNGTTVNSLTKAGAGALGLSAVNTYTGTTTVTAGNLRLLGSGSVNAGSGVTVNGTGARFTQDSSTAVTVPVGITVGLVDGTGTINTVNVTSGAANGVTHGDGTVAPLTIGTLTYAATGVANFLTSAATASTTKINVTSSLVTGTGNITINGTNTVGYWDPGTYSVISYAGSPDTTKFVAGTFGGLGGRQSATVNTATAGLISINIGGNRAVWNGTGDTNWDPANVTNNWKLSSNSAATNFVTNDAVVFDDSAAASTTVNLTANVSPANVIFNNTIAKPYTIQGGFAIANSTTPAVTPFVVMNGTGTVTITNANTYTGGTVENAGTLILNNNSAIGTGALTINGGTIGTTLAGTTLANALNLNSDISVDATNSLTLNGTTTLGGSGTTRTITVSAGILGIGPITTNTGYGLTVAGPGTLLMNATNTTNSTISGPLTVSAGSTLNITRNFTATGLAGTGTIAAGPSASATRTLVINATGNNTFGGTLVDGNGAQRLSVQLGGDGVSNGRLTLTGANTYSGQTLASNGVMNISGSITPAQTTGNPNPFLQVGLGFGTQAAANVLPGANIVGINELWIGPTAGDYGVMNMSGGTVTTGSWMVVGRGGRGLLNMTGGTLNVNSPAGQHMTIGTVNGTYEPGRVDGQVNLSGGVINAAQEVFVGESQNGVLNVSGSGYLKPGVDVRLATNSNATGILNLGSGGTLQTPLLRQGNGRAIANFHGGTLAATADNNTNFLGGITGTASTGSFNAYVYSEGAVFDSAGHSITVSQPLLAPTGNGVSAAGLTVSGSGFIGAPIVDITGGGGIGATANATVDSSGNLTGIVITNPGVGYASAPTFTLQGGGLGNTGAISGTATLVANTSGALNKIGTGTLTLSGANTYTGGTIVSGGTLVLGSATALPANTNLVVNGGTFSTLGATQALTTNKLVVNGSGAIDLVGGGSLSFADSSSLSSSWNGAISILHWNGTPNTPSATDPIFVGTSTSGLTASQLQSIHFGRNGANAYNGAALLSSGEIVPTSLSTRVLGDFNVSGGNPTAADIPAMLTALTDLNVYKTSHSLSNDDVLNIGDVNGDGKVSNLDIQAELDLVASLGGGATAAVPEPESFVLMLLGAIPGLMIARVWRKNSTEKARQA